MENIAAGTGTGTGRGKPPPPPPMAPPRLISCAPAAARLHQQRQEKAKDEGGAGAGAVVGETRQSGLTACALCAALSSTSLPSSIMRMMLPGVEPVSRSAIRSSEPFSR